MFQGDFGWFTSIFSQTAPAAPTEMRKIFCALIVSRRQCFVCLFFVGTIHSFRLLIASDPPPPVRVAYVRATCLALLPSGLLSTLLIVIKNITVHYFRVPPTTTLPSRRLWSQRKDLPISPRLSPMKLYRDVSSAISHLVSE